ncbi:MAG: hypothetical protein ACTHMR_21580, partial [Thermomicrobiales bacterium]
MTTTLTTAEQAGIEQFKASLAQSTPFQRQTTLAALQPGGGIERQKGAPRREVLDEMARIIREFDAPAPAPAGTVRVRIAASGQQFGQAVADAKRAGGTFDGQTKTWLIPASAPQL